ncbi:MAG: glycosyltransferase [Oscillospiraceae bacterium]|nr:glycosyltransferase [Oscillospiraceae bacterium]
MNILVLPSWYSSKESPNSGSFFREQAQALARYGHTVSVLVIRPSDTGKTSLEKSRTGDITEYYLHVKPLPCHLSGMLVMGELIRLFRTEFRSRPIDIMHVHSFRSGRYARFIKAAFHIPYVVTEHFTGFQLGSVTGKRWEEARKVYTDAAEIVAVSTGLRDSIAPLCPREIRVIPNMVSEQFFSGGLRLMPTDGTFQFVSIGYLVHKKGFDVLLRAFAQVCARTTRVKLIIIGGGDREPFEKQAEELGISDSVTFTGALSREEVAWQLRRSQAFVLLSRAETFGVCFIEAMACGLPIVMTKTDAWELLATRSTGLAVEVDDDKAASDAMLQIISQYDSYSAEEISDYCRDHFSEQAVCRQLTELYERVLEENK